MTITSKYRLGSVIFSILSLLCFAAAPAYFTVEALLTATLTAQKIALCTTVMAVLIMTIVAAVNKVAMRSRIWLLLIGLWVCLDNFLVPVMVIAITQVADELIFTPAHKWFKTRYTINQQFDKRMAAAAKEKETKTKDTSK